MKIRNIAFIFTLLAGVLFLIARYEIKQDNLSGIDMVYYNRATDEISKSIKKDSADLEELLHKYRCTLVYTNDAMYKSRINELISKECIIIDYIQDDVIKAKLCFEGKTDVIENTGNYLFSVFTYAFIALVIIGYLLLFVVYRQYVKPFRVLKKFSGEIARGNLDFPLPMNKNNFFGAFTESFDIMREELRTARENEYKANVSKKELVAQLSHDIKTPVSTIKATCELMELTQKDEKTLKKIKIIQAKTETIDKLIGNMFSATMEELTMIKVEGKEESTEEVLKIIEELKFYGSIEIKNQIPECIVIMDKLRLEQVIGNIINNSYKYAKTKIEISFKREENGIVISIRDGGGGVPQEELPYVMEKYYRGENAKGKDGSGLGLYLSKVFMERMQGAMDCYNDNGFVVNLFLRKV